MIINNFLLMIFNSNNMGTQMQEKGIEYENKL